MIGSYHRVYLKKGWIVITESDNFVCIKIIFIQYVEGFWGKDVLLWHSFERKKNIVHLNPEDVCQIPPKSSTWNFATSDFFVRQWSDAEIS